MCELLGMSSRNPVQLTFSLEALASHSAPPGSHREGWGAAFYQDKDVALFREPVAASESALVRFLEQQGPPTTLAISHIRHATRGPVSLANTQPFVRECMGRMHVFAHNGDLPGIERSSSLCYDRYRPIGETDSEHAFCALMERFAGATGIPPLEERLSLVAGFATDLRKLGPANFLYADGDALFAFGDRRTQPGSAARAAPGLVMQSCACVDGKREICVRGLSISPGFQEVTLIASVPLIPADAIWRPFREGELIAVANGRVQGETGV